MTLPAQTGVTETPRFMRFIARYPLPAVGVCLLLLVVGCAILAPFLAPQDPLGISPAMRNRPPSAEHWFGTDSLGRDLCARVVYGARVSIAIGFGVAITTTLAGIAIGLVSGFVRWADGPIMRVMDGIMAIPSILLAIALMALLGGSITNVIVAISIAETPRFARLVRSGVLSLRELLFVEAATVVGAGTRRIVLVHVLPNMVGSIIVQATFVCAGAIISESILSFIGAGLPPSTPSWGNIMAEGRGIWQIFPYPIFFPSIFLTATVLSINLIGDGLRDYFDPRQGD